MYDDNDNIEELLDTDRLEEIPRLADDAARVSQTETVVAVGNSHVALRRREGGAVVIVDYPSETDRRDTAYYGSIVDAEDAVVRLAECWVSDVVRDDFDLLAAEQDGDRR
ncbi:hypothetical protein [Natronomonas marina]|uniref:hypothetical protein n=1 Tax=Natronomonas marina TaxID=2961939 RepID=UPI0020CA0EA5|nr:hypothetical protein [Natronomonas marina]